MDSIKEKYFCRANNLMLHQNDISFWCPMIVREIKLIDDITCKSFIKEADAR